MTLNIKRRLKFELYGALLNALTYTDNEAQILHRLAVDDDVQSMLKKRARMDYAAMNRQAKKDNAMNPCNDRLLRVSSGSPHQRRQGNVPVRALSLPPHHPNSKETIRLTIPEWVL